MTSRAAILAVEDNAANIALLRAVLRRASHERLRDAELRVATTLRDGHDALRGARYDVVLLDVRLPDGSGLELMPAIRAASESTRVVVLTANALPADEHAARAAGADEFVAKPYDPHRLLSLLATLIEGES